MSETLVFGSPSLLGYVAALTLLGILLVVFRSVFSSAGWTGRVLGPLLKLFAIVLLAICTLEPQLSGLRARPGANLFLVLADNSESLTIKDPGETATRGEQMKMILNTKDAAWLIRLSQDFDLRRYIFDSQLQSVADFSRLKYDGQQSNLVSVLNGLKERFRDRPLAGVLLFTDGVATDGKNTKFEANGLPPIYPVVMGNISQERELVDLAVSHLTVTTTAFEDAPVTIQADVAHTSLSNTTVTAQVRDESGIIVTQETQTFANERGPLPFRLQLRPPKPGVSFYEVRVRTEGEAKRTDAVPMVNDVGAKSGSLLPIIDSESVETTLANNRRLVAIDRGSSKYRILYLSGRPNWEYKFLRRAIESDDQVQLTAIIRVAKKEPKFVWRNKLGENSNPLFKGFEGKTEETERYDQPVLVRLNTKTPEELREGFPKTAEQLYQFHAVIIDDLEADFFSPDQLSLLERFVTERGGGLLMLGGAESFRNGGYEKTPIGRGLPVYLDNLPESKSSNSFRLALTRDGWLQPWARLRSTEIEEKQRIAELPSFQTLNRTGRIKPGGTVIAEVLDAEGTRYPALAVQTFGRGRCAAMMIGDLWRSQIDRSDTQREKDDLGKSWRQTIRWLIADVPDQIELQTTSIHDLGQPLTRVEIRVRTAVFQPQDNAAVNVKLQIPDGTSMTQSAEPSLQEPGLFEATFATRQSGCYRAKVEVTNPEGQPMGIAETGWTIDPASEEFSQVIPNREFLAEVAQKTAGEIVLVNRLDAFVRSLANRKVPITEAYTTPVWHQLWIFLLVVVALLTDWALRRYRGFP